MDNTDDQMDDDFDTVDKEQSMMKYQGIAAGQGHRPFQNIDGGGYSDDEPR